MTEKDIEEIVEEYKQRDFAGVDDNIGTYPLKTGKGFWGKIREMIRYFLVFRVVRILAKYEKPKGQDAKAWFSNLVEEREFIDYLLDKKHFWEDLRNTFVRYFGMKKGDGFFVRQKKQKEIIKEVLQKAKRRRVRNGYQDSFQYITHPLTEQTVIDEWNPLAGVERKMLPDEKFIYVTDEGKELFDISIAFQDLWQESDKPLLIIGTILVGVIGGTYLSFTKTVLVNGLCVLYGC